MFFCVCVRVSVFVNDMHVHDALCVCVRLKRNQVMTEQFFSHIHTHTSFVNASHRHFPTVLWGFSIWCVPLQ